MTHPTSRPLPQSPYLEVVLAGTALVGVMGVRIFLQSYQPAPHWVADIVLCAVAMLAARRPLAAALTQVGVFAMILAFLPTYVGMGFLGAFVVIFALFRLQVPYRWWMSALVWGFGLCVFARVTRSVGETLSSALLMLVLLLLSIGGAVVWRRMALAAEQTRELSARRMSALRVALARDLHDTVAQTLSHAAMRAYLASDDDSLSPQARQDLDAIAEECTNSARDLRQLLTALREFEGETVETGDTPSDAVELEASIERQRERLLTAGLDPDIALDLADLSPAQATTLAKITVEAVSNMIKHAPPGSRCAIRLSSDELVATARYSNPSRALTPPQPGTGLIGVHERAGLLGGTSEQTLSDGIWELRVTLPLDYQSGTAERSAQARRS
ncbi:sensor histidine kinase [Tessaracoccus flavescens]|uniref:sensor histidine kinase n=1 Tax=Tessaracoccus flavescens TaxID=399497 RepID=UPI001260259D|nr:histidine kinase [Tessaracoccus flavescens]